MRRMAPSEYIAVAAYSIANTWRWVDAAQMVEETEDRDVKATAA